MVGIKDVRNIVMPPPVEDSFFFTCVSGLLFSVTYSLSASSSSEAITMSKI